MEELDNNHIDSQIGKLREANKSMMAELMDQCNDSQVQQLNNLTAKPHHRNRDLILESQKSSKSLENINSTVKVKRVHFCPAI